MKLYKLTDKNGCTYNNTQWGEGGGGVGGGCGGGSRFDYHCSEGHG